MRAGLSCSWRERTQQVADLGLRHAGHRQAFVFAWVVHHLTFIVEDHGGACARFVSRPVRQTHVVGIPGAGELDPRAADFVGEWLQTRALGVRGFER